ncbi:hypothetical protein KP509_13G058100 [Ceratopteris richardii]|nr:hypothetical protein KP509_13G058100 [Ceratopteris richardii]
MPFSLSFLHTTTHTRAIDGAVCHEARPVKAPDTMSLNDSAYLPRARFFFSPKFRRSCTYCSLILFSL